MAQAKTLELPLFPHTWYLIHQHIFCQLSVFLNPSAFHFLSPSPKFKWPLLHFCNSLTGSQLPISLPTLHLQSTHTAPRVTWLKCHSDQVTWPTALSCGIRTKLFHSPTKPCTNCLPLLLPTSSSDLMHQDRHNGSLLCISQHAGLLSHDTWDTRYWTEIHVSPAFF